MRAAVAACVVLAACWTDSVPPPPQESSVPPTTPQPLVDVDVTMERTACFGRCPEYSVEIHHDGRVVWHGVKYVATIGTATSRVSAMHLQQLARAIQLIRFFDLDEGGHLPVTDSWASGMICSDTSSATITVRMNGVVHTANDNHCEDHEPLEPLEELIDRIAGTAGLIGRSR